MPYDKFTKRGNTVRVHKKGGGGFTSHSPSKAKAHKTAAMREMAAKGTLRVAKRRRKTRKKG
jgi:hypothetical protein